MLIIGSGVLTTLTPEPRSAEALEPKRIPEFLFAARGFAQRRPMNKRFLLAGSSLIFVLAACGGTPQVKAATPAEKKAITANVANVTTKLQGLNLTSKASTLAAQAVNGSVTVDCDTGSLTLSFSSDTNTAATASSGSMNLKSASCTEGDVTLSNVDLTLKYNGSFSSTNASFKFVYDGAITYKDAKETINLKFTNMIYDSKFSSETVAGKTKYTFTTTLNGTVSANDSFVTYENEVVTQSF
jgi:hypothetical protein